MRVNTGNSGFARLDGVTTLTSSFLSDLYQLQFGAHQGDVLDIVAACIRHRESALILLRHRELVWPLTLFPRQDLYHLTWPLVDSLREGPLDLQVIDVEPPGLGPPEEFMSQRDPVSGNYRPLPLLLWALALKGPRALLLKDIGGRAAYRLSPDFKPDASLLSGALGPAVRRLHSKVASLDDIARWPGMDRERGARMLNGIYLQGGLIVLRANRAARHAAGPIDRIRGWLNPPR